MRAVSSRPLHLDADEDVRLLRIGDAVVELGDVARAERRAEACGSCRGRSGMVTARTASRCSPSSASSATKRRRSKLMLAPEAIATSVLSARAVPLDPGLGAGDGERAGRLEHRARVLEHVLDRGADLVGVDAAPSRRPAPGRGGTSPRRPASPRRRRRTGRRGRASPAGPPSASAASRRRRPARRRSIRTAGARASRTRRCRRSGRRRRPARRSRRSAARCWRRISMPIVPCPAITSGSSYGCTNVRPRCRCTLQACA